ncbi:MAG: FAD-binding oxidoreductase [Dehalococcoidia bacterium]|nr:MAG: FAD-binding oxidoreductase [Dehalococcoidia bacterium]
MSSQKEIVIVGAGVIGSSIAYHLSRQGVPSQVIEVDSIAARASGKAWAVWSYPPEYLVMEGLETDQLLRATEGSIGPWLEMLSSSYHRIADVAQDLKETGGIDPEYGELSLVMVARSESEEKDYKDFIPFIKNASYHEGYWMSDDELRAIYPDITSQSRGAVVVPQLQVEPYQYTLGLFQAAEKRGASIRQGEVVGFRHKGSKVTSVTLATGTEVEADVFVLATGPWSGQVTSLLGKPVPIIISRLQCLRVEVPKQFPPYELSISEAAFSIIPKVNGTVIMGYAGIPDIQASPDVSLTTEEFKNKIVNEAVGLLPSLQEAKITEHRGDLECWGPPPNCVQPALGRLPGWDNVYIATRFGTSGMMLSLGAGQVMADLIIAGGRAPARFKQMLEALDPAKL